MFIKPKYKNPNEYLREVQNDLLIPFMTVHDEIDYLCNESLLEPLMFKVGRLTHQKQVINRLGYPYINFLLDIEYDPYGSWTASKGIDLYETPYYESENEWYKKYHGMIGSNRDSKSIPEAPSISPDSDKVEVIEVSYSLKEIMRKLETKKPEEVFKWIAKIPDGNCRISITHKDTILNYDRLIDNKSIEELLSNDLEI